MRPILTFFIFHLLDVSTSYIIHSVSTSPGVWVDTVPLTGKCSLRPCYHNSADFAIVVSLQESMVEFSKERGAEGVQSLGAVQGDESDRGVGAGGEDVGVVVRHGHESSSDEICSGQGLIKRTGYVVEHGMNEVTDVADGSSQHFSER